MSPSAAFRLDGVSVRFRDTAALDSVSLEIASGEAVALVGPSGAGKTTLLRLLNATQRPSSGAVYVDGQDIASLRGPDLRRVRAAIGFVHQDLSLVPNLRVIHNVVAGRLGRMGLFASLRAMARTSPEDTEAVHRLLERVGIPDKLYERTDRLSGGQRQRVAIARALFQEPEALLADEPVSSVDPARARDTVALLTDISQERGLTLCMSIHNVELARAHFPRIVALRGGRVQFDKPTASVTDAELTTLFDLSREELMIDGHG